MSGFALPVGTEVLRAALVGAVYVAMFAGIELWKRWRKPPVEWTRKAAHVGGGLVALAFPWLFATHWTVLGLGAGMAALLWGTRRAGLLGGVHDVSRQTEGGLYYPLAIYVVFLIGAHRPAFYLVAVLTLVLSDALAALVGSAYGRTMYAVETDRRSVEGSVVFFLTTFLGVHLPLLLLTPLDRGAVVLIATQIALLVTFLEAISLRGSDNLVVPLATYYFLVKLTPHSAAFIGEQLVSQLAIIAVIALLARGSRFLTASGVLAAALMFYGAWSLGGPEWIVAPAVGLAIALIAYAYLIGRRTTPGAPAPNGLYQVRAVFYTSVIPVALYVLNNAFETLLPVADALRADPFYPLYVGALGAQLGIILLDWIEGCGRLPGAGARRRLIALAPALAIVVPAGLAVGLGETRLADVAAAVAVCAIGFGAYATGRGSARWPANPPWALRLQTVSVAIGLGAVLAVQLGAGLFG